MGGSYNKVGKQDEFVLGADYSYNFMPTYKAWAAYAHSIYQPTGSDGVDVHGNLFNTGISGTVGRVSFNLEGFWVEPKYDPFVIKTERPSEVQAPGLFYELPYFTTYADSWQLHDAKKYPQNREGVRLHLDYPFPHPFFYKAFCRPGLFTANRKFNGRATSKSLVL